MTTEHRIELPPKLLPVFSGKARYRGAYGGRGSGKTRSFAKMAAVQGLIAASNGASGIILCAREYMNSLDDSSMAEVKAAIESDEWLTSNYEIGEKFIRTGDHLPGRVDFKFAGLNRNLDSLKSKAKIILCWVDEAEPVIETAWVKLIPTVREHDSEIWVTWNPEAKRSATHQRFRLNATEDMKIVELNWRDNPWFPQVLDQERRRDKKARPEQYSHIWEGDFATVIEGAYYAEQLALAERNGRIAKLKPDQLLPIYTYHDIGGSGRNADAYAIWVCQFVDDEIRLLAHYEAQGQSLKYHVRWLRRWCEERDFNRVVVRLPHDGVSEGQGVTGLRYQDHWSEASDSRFEFDVDVIPNMGKGAAMQRIEAARRLFLRMSFDKEQTEAGREALAHYHEKIDEQRGIGLGPNHDWASHTADAFGLMAVDYSPPQRTALELEVEDFGYV